MKIKFYISKWLLPTSLFYDTLYCIPRRCPHCWHTDFNVVHEHSYGDDMIVCRHCASHVSTRDENGFYDFDFLDMRK